MKYFGSLIVLLALLLTTSSAYADLAGEEFANEHGDFFNLLLSEKSDVLFYYDLFPSYKEDGGPGEFDLNVFGAEFELPIPIDVDSFFRFGLSYQARDYDFTQIQGAPIETGSEILHRAVADVGYGYFFNNDFLFTGKARVGVYSNFESSPSEDDVLVLGEAMLVYRPNPTAQLVLGARVSRDFDEHDIIPLVGVRILGEDGKLHISITAPVELRVGYKLVPDVEIYAGGWISGDEYHVEISNREFDVHVQDRRVGAGLIFWLGNTLSLGVEAGASIESKLEFKTQTPQFSEDLEPGPYLHAQIGFAL